MNTDRGEDNRRDAGLSLDPEKVLPRAIDVRSLFLSGLFVIALVAAIYHGRQFLAPIALALLLNFLLSPAVRILGRLRIPNAVGAAIIMLTLLTTLGGVGYGLAAPMSSWLERAPRSAAELERAAKEWRPRIEEISQAADKVSDIANGSAPESDAVDVRIRSERPALKRAFDSTWPTAANLIVVLILLYFLLAGGDVFVTKLVETLPTMREKKVTVRTLRKLEAEVSSYLVAITVINVLLGLAVGLACWTIGLPNPILWGAMATLFNYVPFLGALAGVGVLGLVSLGTFGVTTMAALAPATYLLISGIEGYLITPTVLGRNLSLSPVAIFVAMLFWGWAWGLIGVLIAVPMLVITKICLSASDRTRPIARFLARE